MSKLKTAFQYIRRTPYQAFSAILITSITFFIISVFILTILGANQVLTYFESRPQVTAFFTDEATHEQVQTLTNQIKTKVNIDQINYISKEDALKIYQQQNADNPLLLEMVTADILPASLEVSAQSVDDLGTIAELMNQANYVEEVVYQQDIIKTISVWVKGVRLAGLALSGLLLITSLVIIIVILGLKFTARKTEINTLSLLGASPWYIRAPFIFEGLIYAMLGALFGWGGAYLALLYLTPNLVTFLQGITLLPVPYWIMLVILGGEFILGIFLGIFASLVATRRYGK